MNWRQRANVRLISEREVIRDGYHVREYTDRIAVSRTDGQRLSWEELQHVKELVLGDRIAVEVFPAANDVVNLRHTRHLWFSPELDHAVAVTCRHPEFGNDNN